MHTYNMHVENQGKDFEVQDPVYLKRMAEWKDLQEPQENILKRSQV